jgi:hypothetical protein
VALSEGVRERRSRTLHEARVELQRHHRRTVVDTDLAVRVALDDEPPAEPVIYDAPRLVRRANIPRP